MNTFHKIIKSAAPVMASVQSLFYYILILSCGGFFIDSRLNTFPLIFIISLFAGLILGFSQLYNSPKKDS